MELFSPSSLFLAFILLLLLKLTGASQRPKTSQSSKLPPGPWQLPVIGSLHHMLGSLPHRRLRDLSNTHGPLMHLNLGEVCTIVVSSAEAAREIMKTHDLTFASRPTINVIQISGGDTLVFAPYGEFWRQMRKICITDLLSAKRVQSFRSIREEEALNLVRSITDSDSPMVNLSRRLDSLANDVTVRAVVGSKCEDQETFLSALKEAIAAAGGFDMVDLFPSSALVKFMGRRRRVRLKKAHSKLDGIVDRIIVDRKKQRMAAAVAAAGGGGGEPTEEEDLLDVLLRVQEENSLDFQLTSNNIKVVVQDMFGAGSETMSTTLIWAMTELVKNPRVMNKVQSEVRGVLGGKEKLTEDDMPELIYLKLVIKETLRLHAPVPLLLPRECMSTCEVLGYEIPEKARVLVNSWAIGRDRKYWGDDVEEFKPERFDGRNVDFKGVNFEFIPFGAGRRICPGMTFAVAALDLALAQLLCYFDWELPGGIQLSGLNMEETFSLTARKKQELWLSAIPCLPCPRSTANS